jgi:hypothetical protein
LVEWKRQKEDPLHVNRENITRHAVSQVNEGQIRPWKDKPLNGNTHLCMRVMLPLIEKVLQIPCADFKEGSDEWIAKIIATDGYTFADCVKYRKVMKAHIAAEIKAGDDRGYPILKTGESVPNRLYSLDSERSANPRSTKRHTDLPFLRAFPCNRAFRRMKNGCLYPILVKAASSPTGEDWSNFVQCRIEFRAHYCDLEGISRTNNLAREILLYMFYGTYWLRGKQVDIIKCLHYKIIAGRHRFGKFVTKHFAAFLEAYDKNVDEWEKYLTDCGKGGNAPKEYCLLVEVGLRSFGRDMHAMGTLALRSKDNWAAVQTWRKREAYIALVRHIRGHTGYAQYDCYHWRDYVERQRANKTFLARHLPLSNGDNFGGDLPDPPEWASVQEDEPTPKKRRRKVEKIKAEPIPLTQRVVVKRSSSKPMVWDVENDRFVAFE